MKTVFLVSCDFVEEIGLDSESHLLQKALHQRGIESSIVTWEDKNVKWEQADLAITRIVSSYMGSPNQFIEWAKLVEKTTTLWNSSPIIEWNIHKKYLVELQNKGIPIPETILIPQNTEKEMSEIIDLIPWDDFILKPCICEGSAGLKRFNKKSPDLETHFRNLNKNGFQQQFEVFDGVYDYPAGDTLIQQYVPEITSLGEASLFYFGSEYSHAVIKNPKAGDFRAHSIWGADVKHYNPTKKEIEVGNDSIEIAGNPVEFARIDMIPTRPLPLIIEVELLDPFFFFEFSEGTVDLYADHIVKSLNR